MAEKRSFKEGFKSVFEDPGQVAGIAVFALAVGGIGYVATTAADKIRDMRKQKKLEKQTEVKVIPADNSKKE